MSTHDQQYVLGRYPRAEAWRNPNQIGYDRWFIRTPLDGDWDLLAGGRTIGEAWKECADFLRRTIP